jgi:hypothetical protein
LGKSGPKYQSIYIKAEFEIQKPAHQTPVETLKYLQQTACLGQNWLSKK